MEELARKSLLDCIEKLARTKLVYRGSRDGFLQSNFMDKMATIQKEYPCSLIVVKTSEKKGRHYVFGGFTDIPWKDEGPEEGIIHNNNSFIFSLRENG